MADRDHEKSNSSLSELDKGGTSSDVPQPVFALIENMNANWQKQFDDLKGLISRSQATPTSEDEDDYAPPEPVTKKRRTEDRSNGPPVESDVLTIDEVDLEELEDNLITPKPKEVGTEQAALLKDIESELNVEELFGKNVRDDLANIVNGRFENKLGADLQKKKFELYNRPENCAKLVVPIVNNDIWTKLPPEAMRKDLKLQHIQRTVVKAAIAATRAADVMLAASGAQNAEAIRHNTDAIALLGHASREISLRRRTAIKPHVNKQFARICDDSIPITDQLFGDNLSVTMKEIREKGRISANFSPSDRKGQYGHKSRNYRPHGPAFPDSGRRGSFLGRGNRGFRRQGGNPQNPRRGYKGHQNPNYSH